jgi:hypothetical protein
MGQIDAEGCRALFCVTDGCNVVDYAMMQEPGKPMYWVFVVDVSKDNPFGADKPMPEGWDFRNLMRRP